jgi:hypothetical protein
MPKTIEIPELTATQAEWLKMLLSEAAEDALATAKNNHLWALGSKTQKSAIQFERFAEETREYAKILHEIIEKLD